MILQYYVLGAALTASSYIGAWAAPAIGDVIPVPPGRSPVVPSRFCTKAEVTECKRSLAMKPKSFHEECAKREAVAECAKMKGCNYVPAMNKRKNASQEDACSLRQAQVELMLTGACLSPTMKKILECQMKNGKNLMREAALDSCHWKSDCRARQYVASRVEEMCRGSKFNEGMSLFMSQFGTKSCTLLEGLAADDIAREESSGV